MFVGFLINGTKTLSRLSNCVLKYPVVLRWRVHNSLNVRDATYYARAYTIYAHDVCSLNYLAEIERKSAKVFAIILTRWLRLGRKKMNKLQAALYEDWHLGMLAVK